MTDPTAYDLILTQLQRIEQKLDKLPDTFIPRNEYEKRHEEILRAMARTEGDIENDVKALTERVKRCEDNFTKLLWAFGGTVGITGIGLIIWLVQQNLG